VSYSTSSKEELSSCDFRIQEIFNIVGEEYESTIIRGHRGEAEQNHYFYTGRSKVKFPYGKHNSMPSLAVDAAPYNIARRGIPWPKVPTDWNDKNQRQFYIKDLAEFYHFAAYVIAVARRLGYKIRWGGDWDMDHDFRDNNFDDLVHFEIIE